MEDNNDPFIIFESPKIEPPEFRVYYNDKGEIVCYTCEKLEEGNYIVIDRQTFAEMRFDVKVINGKIKRFNPNAKVQKQMPSNDEDAIKCYSGDITIIVDDSYNEEIKKWKLVSYDLPD